MRWEENQETVGSWGVRQKGGSDQLSQMLLMVKEHKDWKLFLFFLPRMLFRAPCISLVVFYPSLQPLHLSLPLTPRLVKGPSNALCIPPEALVTACRYVFACMVI